MDTDLDPDDAIGRRLGALQDWVPATPIDDAWRRVETRRGRRRARRYAAGTVVAVIPLVASFAVVANLRSSDRRVLVTAPPDPPIVSVLTTAPVGDIAALPAGPYRAGQAVRVRVRSSATFRPDDPTNQVVELCFSYASGEICDAAVQSSYNEQSRPGVAEYDVTLPGWVHSPTGLQSCVEIACRLEIENSDSARIGTPPLDIEPGPKPVEPARIVAVHADGTISVRIDGLLPDPSWTALNLPAKADFPPGDFAVCAFGGRISCDAVVRPDPPPFDGAPHDLVIPTNRLLLTHQGWVDCAEYVCEIRLTRVTGAAEVGGGIGLGGVETLAALPYRLPPTTPVMARPSLTIDRPGPYGVDDTVSVTLHDPPSNIDAASRLRLGQCSQDDLAVAMGCLTRFSDISQQTQSWTRLADGSLRQQWQFTTCADARGCYLAIEPLLKGYPEVARTLGRFTVSPDASVDHT